MTLTAKQWLEQIRQLPLSRPLRIMNVCGGHERSISMAGLRSALPDAIELIPGPGCPVCVCPEEDIDEAIQLALNENIILLAFGDMLRVPVNVSKQQPRSLEQARAAGADIRAIASPTEAIRIALANPQKKIVFFVAGFETTTAPVAAMIAEAVPHNLLILLSARLTWPAVAMLLKTEQVGFDALIAPGHVATVMGANEWKFVVEKHQLPTAVAGFSSESLLAGFYSVARQVLEKNIFLDNCYAELVNDEGNQTAQKYLHQVMDVVDANWRGIGIIPASGFALNSDYRHMDVHQHYATYRDDTRHRSHKRAGQMPAGCDCAAVVLGKLSPSECKLYGRACTPRNPVGPCMVSDEGACHIWWNSGVREKSAITA